MRAQNFAEISANLFLYGLPVVIIGIPAIAAAIASLPLAAQPILGVLFEVLAAAGYVGLPCIGLAGACVGLWCHFRKDCEYSAWKPLLVIVLLVIYVAIAVVATQAYRAMHQAGRSGRAPVSLRQ